MKTVHLDDDLLAAMVLADEPIDHLAREAIVIHLYRRHTISSGRAAMLLGMSRIDFIKYTGELGIPFFDMTEEEWDDERARVDAWVARR